MNNARFSPATSMMSSDLDTSKAAGGTSGQNKSSNMMMGNGMISLSSMSSASSNALVIDESGSISKHLKQTRSFDDDDHERMRPANIHQHQNHHHSYTNPSSEDEDDEDEEENDEDIYKERRGVSASAAYRGGNSNSSSSGGGHMRLMDSRQRHESAYSNSSQSHYDGMMSQDLATCDRNNNNRYSMGDIGVVSSSYASDSGSYANAQMMKKPRGELTCVVCGAAANGYNFDAITCESCKAFFRRNAFRPLNLFRCSNNNACQITVVTRKKCKKCRIMKCFNLGMRRDWIMTEVEREEKRRKIAMNKTKPGPVTNGSLMSHMDESSQDSQSSPFLSNDANHSFSGSQNGGGGGAYLSENEMMPTGNGNKPIRRRRRRRRAGFGGGSGSGGDIRSTFDSVASVDPVSLPNSQTDNSPHIPTSSSYSSMHSYGVNSYGHIGKPVVSTGHHMDDHHSHRSPYIPSHHYNHHHHTSPLTGHRHAYSPTSAYYDSSSRSLPPASVGTSSDSHLTNYVNTSGGGSHDELVSKRKRQEQMLDEPNDSAAFLPKSNLGLLEQYKLTNSDKIVVSRDVELKTKVTELERSQIEAILEAYKQAIRLVKAHGIPKSSEDINTTINLTELGVRRLIFFFKLISDFRNLDHDLMVKLLKKNMMNLIQIHGVNSYNKKENTFKEPDSDDTPFSALSLESIYGPDIYKLTIGITQNLFDLCNGDTTYIKVLLLIVLFDPMNELLTESEREQIVNLQNKYVTLFHAYMCDSFGKDKGSITFKSIIYEMNKVNDLAQWFEKVVAEKTNYEYVRPLMKEVFSLNQQTSSSSSNLTSAASTAETSTPPASVATDQTPCANINPASL